MAKVKATKPELRDVLVYETYLRIPGSIKALVKDTGRPPYPSHWGSPKEVLGEVEGNEIRVTFVWEVKE